jgi:hypothetical protein
LSKETKMIDTAIRQHWMNSSDRGGFNERHYNRVIEFRRLNEVNGVIEMLEVDELHYCKAGF